MRQDDAAAEYGDAVVIGGSMAGLLATRALSEHFARVTLIERDRFPDGPVFRAGVPQSRHAHVLLQRGLFVLEKLFPGYEDELLAADAVRLFWPADIMWLTPSGWSRRYTTGRRLVSASRELIEGTVRSRVAALPNVRLRERCDVVGLEAGPDGAVSGVRVRDRDAADGAEKAATVIPASFVVDASGRDSHAAEWLAELGCPRPEETRIDAFLGYASRTFAPPAGFAADWKMLFLQGEAGGNTRAGGLFPIEGGRWLVTLAGIGRDYPPTDEEGYLEFARSLRTPLLYDAIKDATPLTPIYGYRRTANQQRHFERLDRRPEGFVVMGDATCAFNPIYGQGMTVAANEALILAGYLNAHRRLHPDGDLAGLAARLQRRIAKASADPWLIATSEDLRHPATEGARPDLRTRLTHKYFDRVLKIALTDEAVGDVLADVMQLKTPPTTLFKPGVLVAALRGAKPVPETPPTRETATA